MSIKIPITEKMLLEWLMNTDYNGKPFSDKLLEFIDEYNRLEDEVKKQMRLHNRPNRKLDELGMRLHEIGVSPNGGSSRDYWISPRTTEKCNSNPRFKKQVDELIARYEAAFKEDQEEYIAAVEPYAIEFNEFHNAHIKELNYINRKLYGSSATLVKKISPINKLPEYSNL